MSFTCNPLVSTFNSSEEVSIRIYLRQRMDNHRSIGQPAEQCLAGTAKLNPKMDDQDYASQAESSRYADKAVWRLQSKGIPLELARIVCQAAHANP
jgi:hypothetical protein